MIKIVVFLFLITFYLKHSECYISSGNCIQSPVISDFNATRVALFFYLINFFLFF
jgi:hypothetical protein